MRCLLRARIYRIILSPVANVLPKTSSPKMGMLQPAPPGYYLPGGLCIPSTGLLHGPSPSLIARDNPPRSRPAWRRDLRQGVQRRIDEERLTVFRTRREIKISWYYPVHRAIEEPTAL